MKISDLPKDYNGPVTLGFRAEDASIEVTGSSVEAPVYSLELLGDATMVTVRVGGLIVSIKADKEFRAEIGETVRANISAAICHLYDGKTGVHL